MHEVSFPSPAGPRPSKAVARSHAPVHPILLTRRLLVRRHSAVWTRTAGRRATRLSRPWHLPLEVLPLLVAEKPALQRFSARPYVSWERVVRSPVASPHRPDLLSLRAPAAGRQTATPWGARLRRVSLGPVARSGGAALGGGRRGPRDARRRSGGASGHGSRARSLRPLIVEASLWLRKKAPTKGGRR
jgi:hypothetical protein